MEKGIGNRYSMIKRNQSQIDLQAKITDKSGSSALNWLRNAITWHHRHLIPGARPTPGLLGGSSSHLR